MSQGVEFLVKSNGGVILNGRGRIIDRNTIEISGKVEMTIKADKIIVATGSKPVKPMVPGINDPKVFVSDDLLRMNSCPEKIVIVGGGVIGVEFATIFNALGKEVTIIEMMDMLLPGTDKEVSELLRNNLEKKGVKIYTSSKLTSILSENNVRCLFEKNEEMLFAEGDIVLVSTGRKPDITGIGLENIGIEIKNGFIKVNDRMETNIKGIYAIGDITGKWQLAHVASAQGLIAAANAAGRNESIKYDIVPQCIYSDPEIAVVGITETESRNKGYNVKIGKFPVSANGKSLIMGYNEGFVKIIANRETGEILGASIMAPRATDMISEICLAMKSEATFEELSNTIHPHPSVSEIIMEAAHDIEGLCIHKI